MTKDLELLFNAMDGLRMNLHEVKLDRHQETGYSDEVKTLDEIEQLLIKADGLASRLGY